MEQSKKVGIWIRVSTELQVKEESPEHHEARARYYTQAKGWQVMEVYKLEAVSGKSVIGHPEAKRMLADIRSGHITGLVFSKLARLARSTKELLEFAEIFRHENADLISLSENIDTSSPAGRLFFTIISAMAEWEREEIAARVAASVPIRAKMGKPLGGAAPFGYKWVGKDFLIDEQEAPVRKLMYELFITLQRKQTVAKKLNDLGYRTRNNSQFTATTIDRLLRDSTAKGQRRANYTKSPGKNKNWQIKPENEWIYIPCVAIVTDELWNQVNAIMDAQSKQRTPIGPKATYLLSGFVTCAKGHKMYVYQGAKVYACPKCKTRIAVDDLDEIYQVYLKDYLGSINHKEYLEQSDNQLQDCKVLLESTTKERNKLAKKMSDLLNLRLEGELSKESFAQEYKPLEERVAQFDAQLPQLEAEIDVRTIQLLSGDTVISEAKTLLDEWHTMTMDQKRVIVETITTGIEIGKEDITITLAYAPPLSQNPENSSHHFTAVMMPNFRNVHRQETDFKRGYMVFYTATRAGWGHETDGPQIGATYKDAISEPGGWDIYMMMQGETIPKESNHVFLSADQKDDWGVPLLTVSVAYDENDEKLKDDFLKQGVEMLEKAGCKNISPGDNHWNPGLDIHEVGGVRMGKDPQTSMLNQWNQLHHCPNVFVTDGACMTSTGVQNPSLTFMALTARAASYAIEEFRKGNL